MCGAALAQNSSWRIKMALEHGLYDEGAVW